MSVSFHLKDISSFWRIIASNYWEYIMTKLDIATLSNISGGGRGNQGGNCAPAPAPAPAPCAPKNSSCS